MSTEIKQNVTPSFNSVRMLAEMELIQKKVREMKEELLIAKDKWAKQFPLRLLSTSGEYLSARDLTRLFMVCSSWILPPILLNNLWRTRYLADYEASTAETKEIANGG